MKKETRYENFVMKYVNTYIDCHGGVRAAARDLNIDPSIICKWRTGKIIPSVKTFNKTFGTDIKVKKIITRWIV